MNISGALIDMADKDNKSLNDIITGEWNKVLFVQFSNKTALFTL